MSPAIMHRSEEDVYQEHVLEHYEDPYHRGSCANCTHKWEDRNPLCGDKVLLQLNVDSEGKIVEAWFDGDGCCISQASASMLVEAIEGQTLEAARQLSAQDMLNLFGPKLTPNRQKCCLLAWRAFQQAVHAPVSPDESC